MIKQRVLHGSCLTILPEFLVRHELKEQVLQACLENYTLPMGKLYAIYPEREFMPSKTKVFLAALKDFLSGNQ